MPVATVWCDHASKPPNLSAPSRNEFVHGIAELAENDLRRRTACRPAPRRDDWITLEVGRLEERARCSNVALPILNGTQ